MGNSKAALLALLITIPGLAAWYWIDRPTMLHSICTIGLPNFSVPPELDPGSVGCAILGPKSRYRGVLESGFEVANFSSDDFPPVKSESNENDPRSWFNCPQTGCTKDLEDQLAREYFQECKMAAAFHTGFATIDVEGWVTISKGTFGHLDSYPREFYASRIVKVSSPPPELIADWLNYFRQADACL